VSSYGFGNSNNAEIPYLTVFNGYLYASTINYAEGFEVWKTDGTVGQDGYYVWENVVSDGYGDTWNQWGMTMKAFGDYLYVGTAVGAGIVLKDNQPVGTRAFDLIRIGKDDNVQLVVGAYVPSDPPDGWPTTRVPLSKWPAGFGNPLNVYVWHMEVLNGVLYLGTFDASSTLMKGLVTIIESLQTDGQVNGFSQQLAEIVNMPEVQSLLQQYPEYVQKLQQLVEIAQTADLETVMNTIAENFGGADLWKTNDGTRWVPITLNGFDDPNNYGIRRLVSVCNTYLFVGTANPYTDDPQGGCQVLEGVKPVHTVYQDGFETGSFSRWTGRKSSGGETAQVTSTLRHDGTYSARFTSDGSSRCEYSYAYKYVKSSTEVRAGGYFKVTSSGLYDGGDTAMLTALKEADGTPVAYGGLRRVCGSTRWVLTTRTSEGWVTTYSPCGMSTNQWYSVRIQWDGCALCQHAELVVNGKTVCSITGEDLGAYGPVGLVEVGLPQLIGCGSMKIYCDNIVISSRA
jgi:hypothetical protein